MQKEQSYLVPLKGVSLTSNSYRKIYFFVKEFNYNKCIEICDTFIKYKSFLISSFFMTNFYPSWISLKISYFLVKCSVNLYVTKILFKMSRRSKSLYITQTQSINITLCLFQIISRDAHCYFLKRYYVSLL